VVEASRLRAIPLFAGLASEDLAAIAQTGSEAHAAAGEKLATEGEFCYALYAIESGTAEVTANGAGLRTLGPGDVFGEIGVLASGVRTASVVATTPLEMIAFFKRDVWALERQAPAAVKRLRALIAERRAIDA
jgi:CRP-like cAMP-binding protein